MTRQTASPSQPASTESDTRHSRLFSLLRQAEQSAQTVAHLQETQADAQQATDLQADALLSAATRSFDRKR